MLALGWPRLSSRALLYQCPWTTSPPFARNSAGVAPLDHTTPPRSPTAANAPLPRAPGLAVRLGVGTPSQVSCSLIDPFQAVAGKNVLLKGTATVPGLYCVTIFDLTDSSGVGSLVAPVAYTINVLHS